MSRKPATIALAFVIAAHATLGAQAHWNLVKIDVTTQGFGGPRQTLLWPTELREMRGMSWQRMNPGGLRRLDVDIVLNNLKTQVETGDGFFGLNAKTSVLVNGPGNDYATFGCGSNVRTSSGYERGDFTSESLNGGLNYRVPNGERTEVGCSPLIPNGSSMPKEDFVLTMRVKWWDGSPRIVLHKDDEGDITFKFTYQWGNGVAAINPATGGSKCFDDPGAASTDRNAHYSWIQQQSASRIGDDLKNKTGILFGCREATNEKLADTFADVSVIIANWVPRASCFGGDEGAASSDWNAHRSWGVGQGRNGMLRNLQGKLAAALNCLNRQQQNGLFADVSVALAKGGS